MATVVSILTAIAAILGVFKYFYKEIAPTPAQADQKIDVENQTQEEKAKKEGRPSP